eukprot:CAMPEP_0119418482 /NCGR_PEP_ID=MMETSP1335-20130426/18344_1 /TAXON_ID=259385 /ORGANISM="Chrysoculter rhomboideus, Strain RCC1486" /LENGTH=44 /DNA_ID= /DNA_START= /DNA_END= /DNA_ORIENTATION=
MLAPTAALVPSAHCAPDPSDSWETRHTSPGQNDQLAPQRRLAFA